MVTIKSEIGHIEASDDIGRRDLQALARALAEDGRRYAEHRTLKARGDYKRPVFGKK